MGLSIFYEHILRAFHPIAKLVGIHGQPREEPMQDNKDYAGGQRGKKGSGAIDGATQCGCENKTENGVESCEAGQKPLGCETDKDHGIDKYQRCPQGNLEGVQLIRLEIQSQAMLKTLVHIRKH